jgi:hypothetical protein
MAAKPFDFANTSKLQEKPFGSATLEKLSIDDNLGFRQNGLPPA